MGAAPLPGTGSTPLGGCAGGAARPGRVGAGPSLQRRRLRRRCPALLAARGGCDRSAAPLDAAPHRSFSPVRRQRRTSPAALRCSALHRRPHAHPPRPCCGAAVWCHLLGNCRLRRCGVAGRRPVLRSREAQGVGVGALARQVRMFEASYSRPSLRTCPDSRASQGTPRAARGKHPGCRAATPQRRRSTKPS